MPNKCMSNDKHFVFLAKLNISIGGSIIKNPIFLVDEPRFQRIFKCDGIKLLYHNGLRSLVFSRNDGIVDGNAHFERLFVGFFEGKLGDGNCSIKYQ